LAVPAGRNRARSWNGLRVAAFVALPHAILTIFDVTQGIFIHLSGDPASTKFFVNNPMLALSLLDNIGMSPLFLGTAVAAIVVLHIALYFPVRHLLAALAGRAARAPLAVAGRRFPGWLLLMVALAGLVGLHLVLPEARRAGEPFYESTRQTFQMAPAALMAGMSREREHLPLRPPPPGSRPLVLIVVDALRRDRMGIYNPELNDTPFLKALESTGKLNRFNAYSTCTFSFCGIMSIFASKSWNSFGSQPVTLLDQLTAFSYESHMILTGQHGNFGDLLKVIGGKPTSVAEQPLGHQPDDRFAVATLKALPIKDPQHAFLYFHLMSAHAGSYVEPPFRFDPDDDGKLGAYLFVPGGKASYRQIYDLRVRQVDEVLRRIFAELGARGILEDALVVITSDHGQRTSEGGLLYHGGDADPPTRGIRSGTRQAKSTSRRPSQPPSASRRSRRGEVQPCSGRSPAAPCRSALRNLPAQWSGTPGAHTSICATALRGRSGSLHSTPPTRRHRCRCSAASIGRLPHQRPSGFVERVAVGGGRLLSRACPAHGRCGARREPSARCRWRRASPRSPS
jgi:hypothetical protein